MPFKKNKLDTTSVRGRTPQRQASTHGQVFSYHANRAVRMSSMARDIEEPQRQEAPHPKRMLIWFRRLPTMAALLLIFVITVATLQLSSNVKVKIVDTNTQVFLRSQSVYEAAAHNEFKTFFNGNKLTVDTQSIAASLQRQFPELKAVSVTLPIVGNRPVVYIQPAIPRVILVARGGTYLLDSSGRALVTGNQVPHLDMLHIPVVTDQSGLSVELGGLVLPQDTISFITEVAGQLTAKNLKITSLTLPAGTNELQARIDGVGYYVKFNLHGDAREEAGAYLAVKGYLDKNHKTPGEYVDVRVENRAYYK